MIKKVTWEKRRVMKRDLVAFLNTYNFQPGKFHIIEHETFDMYVYVIAVKSEIPPSDIKEPQL